MKTSINGNEFFEFFKNGAIEVINNKDYLDSINIFPVEDKDTGSNLAYTLKFIVEFSTIEDSFYKTINSMSLISLENARGNSGVIFAQFLTGIAKETKEREYIDFKEFIDLLKKSSEYVYNSIANPFEGTIISFIRDWTKYLKMNSFKFNNFNDIFLKSFEHANELLLETKVHMKKLKNKNIVDSGANGFLFFLKGICKFFNGEFLELENLITKEKIDIKEENFNCIKYRYCCECLLETKFLDKHILDLKKELLNIGDSLILAGSNKLKHIHIHCNEIYKLFNLISSYGIIKKPKVEDMKIQKNFNKNKENTVILIDSIADIDEKIINKNNIDIIPINIFIDESHYLDKITINHDNFNEKYKRAKSIKSSQPNIIQIKNKINFLKKYYKNILIITVSDKLSGTYMTMLDYLKKNESTNPNIKIINSKLNSGAQGLLVLEAIKLIKEHKNINNIVDELERIKEDIKIYVSINDLSNILRGGRLNTKLKKLIEFFNLKITISLDRNGKGILKYIGIFRRKNEKYILKKINKLKKENKDLNYCIVYSGSKKNKRKFIKEIEGKIGKKALYETKISSVIAMHSGSDAIGIAVKIN
ncbi:MAG: DegV family EDD domain-containing protein [Peptostreptococcaceae bacterium]|jgi:DegV family protein with EDD domain|nr:DegV family EDD domain-containing protein [Peptostreptococcaceae bacterium]